MDIFYPTYCLFCLKRGRFICGDCLNRFTYYEQPCCPVCKGVLRSKKYFIHKICRKHSYLDGLFAVVHYDKFAKLVLKEAKYHFAYKVLNEIAQMMKPQYSNFPFAVDYITYVPLSKTRQNWRGFNQSKILARKLNWKCFELLQKSKYTISQAGLHRSQRLTNLRKSFNLIPSMIVTGKTIVLIDDVCTTGATLQECAKVLKENGAKYVFALVWAKD